MIAELVLFGPTADKIVDLFVYFIMFCCAIWATLYAYEFIKPTQKVGKFDVDSIAKGKKLLKWLGPLMILGTLGKLIYSIGVLIWP